MADDNREPLTIGEFSRWSEGFERRQDAQFDRVHEKLDDHGGRLAVLERSAQTPAAAPVASAPPPPAPEPVRRGRLAAMATAAASMAVFLWEFGKALLHTKTP